MSKKVERVISPKSPNTKNQRRKYPFWIGFLLFSLMLYQTPLLVYCWRVTRTFVEYGFNEHALSGVMRETEWFKRYFTGPMKDEEMIAFFYHHRDDLERAARFYAHKGVCQIHQTMIDRKECEGLQSRIGMSVTSVGPILINSAYRNLKGKCGYECLVQNHYFLDIQPQGWWRSWNSEISAWQKSLLYVPPLLPAEQIGLDPKNYQNNALEVMRRNCRYKISLDVVPPEIEQSRTPHEECAVRHIDGQWFILLRPIVKTSKN